MPVLAPSTAVVADGVPCVVRRAGLGRDSVTHGAQRGRGGEAEYGKELRHLPPSKRNVQYVLRLLQVE